LWAVAEGFGVAFAPDVRSGWTKMYRLLAKIAGGGSRCIARYTSSDYDLQVIDPDSARVAKRFSHAFERSARTFSGRRKNARNA
jgi:hypothetical protein